MMTTCYFETSFSAAFQGAINGLRIFRSSEIGRSDQFGVALILPMDYAVQLMSPLIALSRVAYSLLKRGARMSLHQETTAHLHWHQLDNEHQKDLGSVRFRGAAAHFSNGTTCTTT